MPKEQQWIRKSDYAPQNGDEIIDANYQSYVSNLPYVIVLREEALTEPTHEVVRLLKPKNNNGKPGLFITQDTEIADGRTYWFTRTFSDGPKFRGSWDEIIAHFQPEGYTEYEEV